MIARGEGNLSAMAVRECQRIPKDGRSVLRHIEVVWCNYGDAFMNVDMFLFQVSTHLRQLPIGKVANKLLKGKVESKLCQIQNYQTRRL